MRTLSPEADRPGWTRADFCASSAYMGERYTAEPKMAAAGAADLNKRYEVSV